MQLAWKHQFQFAGYYAALHQGFYRKAGLGVRIVEGGEGRFAREEVLAGRAQYGIAGAELVLHRTEGDPFVVLAPIFQHSPSILLARRNSGISNLQDLIGKRVMLLPGKKDADILAAFLNEGIPLSSIRRLDQSYKLSDLIEGRTDAVSAYLTNEPWHLLQEGVEPAVISPQTYGVDFYSDCLFTTEGEIEAHPARVEAFLSASLRGWEYAMSHPEEIIDLLLTEYGVKKSRDHLRYEAESIREIMLPKLVQIGHMNPGRWRHIARTYVKLGMIEPGFALEGFLYDPHPAPDYTWVRWLVGAISAIVLLVSAVALFLWAFNRKLAAEVAERSRVEAQLRRNEEELSAILETAPDPIVVYDTRGYPQYLNPAFTDLFGWTLEELDGRIPFVPEEEREKTENKISEIYGRGIVGRFESKRLTKDGRIVDVVISAALIKGPENNAAGMVVCITDISKIRELEEQVRQSHKMEAIGTLAGGIAHEFNNILGVIIGNAELAGDGIGEQNPASKNLKEIQKASLRAKDVVGKIFSITRKTPIARRPIQLEAAVEETLELLRSTIPATIDIRSALSPLPGTVLADPTEINQLLINLCTNAAHALGEQAGVVEVGLTCVSLGRPDAGRPMDPGPGDYAKLTVTDNGCGIDPQIMDRVFDPYFTTKEIDKGLGMGLAVVLGIVKQHDGAIRIESGPGQGTTVEVLLPLVDAPQPANVEESECLPPGKERILFVDDEPMLTDITGQVLERLGYEVVCRTDSTEALALFSEAPERFDAVITDMAMPDLPGDRLAREILRIRPELPVILCTGHSDQIDEKTARELGICAFARKPLRQKELAALVRKAIDGCGDPAPDTSF